jgi:putative transposase
LIFSEPDRSDGSKPSDRFPKKQPLVQGISTLLSSYPQAINKQNDWSGSLFRSKTKAIPLIETELRTLAKGNLYQPHYAENCFHYIHDNPVKAKLVKKSEEWEFSSAPDYANKRNGNLCNI